MEHNPIIDKLPPHLQQFIKPQHYEDYTPINQAVWRYVMRKNVSYLKTVAHESYQHGLEETGISIDSIPNMYGMNRILKKIGWAAVAVDGFIPPNAFMEFQAHKILVIASDIRQLEHIEYTPAPDIIHEAAGHAPIIADPDYSEYLRRFGAIGAKAISSSHDNEMYEAIRKLSILKEAPNSTLEEIEKAEKAIDELQNKHVKLSEMALLRNLHWWTVEYGLIGTLDNPKIYGAGLLSSIGESEMCLRENIKKLPYSIDTATQSFDITKPQPQLFVTPDFGYLLKVLEEFADTMAMRKGGALGMEKLIESKKVGTIELNSGLQISGCFSQMTLDENNEIVFFKSNGPTALAYREKELIGHGIDSLKNGIVSPLGNIKGMEISLEDMSPVDLEAHNFYDGEPARFEFESGVKVEGLIITGIRNEIGKLLIIQFSHCTITYKNEVLVSPDDGAYDMPVGSLANSAFAGAADFNSFPNLYRESKTKTIKVKSSSANLALESLYASVREMRNSNKEDDSLLETLFTDVQKGYPNDWLLPIEIMELSKNDVLNQSIKSYLEKLYILQPKLKKLIVDGLALLNKA